MKSVETIHTNNQPKEVNALEHTQLLVGMELTRPDDQLLEYLNFFIQKIPTKSVYFLNVLRPVDIAEGKETESVIGSYDLEKMTMAKLKTAIQSKTNFPDSVYANYEIKEGDPLEELLKATEETKPDMVVMGLHSDKAHHGILPGSFIRKYNGNFLLIPDQSAVRLNRILIPIDFSKNSIRALHTAAALQKRMNGKLELICFNVYDLPHFDFYQIRESRKALKDLIENDRQLALQAFLNNFYPGEINDIKTVLREKNRPGIGRFILDYSNENNIDMIIMGARGHSRSELILLGSVTEQVLSGSKRVPVLVVK